jgi:hypothetical protein
MEQFLENSLSFEKSTSFHIAKGYFEKAGSLFEKALQIQKSKLPKNHPRVAKTLNGMGMSLLEQVIAHATLRPGCR